MKNVIEVNVQQFKDINGAVKDAQKARHAWILETFPIDSVIKFDHNGYTQHGRVQGYDSWYVSDICLLVRNEKTGVVRRVSLFSIGIAYGANE